MYWAAIVCLSVCFKNTWKSYRQLLIKLKKMLTMSQKTDDLIFDTDLSTLS